MSRDEIHSETRDVQGRWAVLTATFLVAMLGLGIAFSFWYFRDDLSLRRYREESYRLPLRTEGPRPGAWTEQSLRQYRQAEEAKLQAYAWRDDSHLFAVVPVDRAIDLAIRNHVLQNSSGGHHAP